MKLRQSASLQRFDVILQMENQDAMKNCMHELPF